MPLTKCSAVLTDDVSEKQIRIEKKSIQIKTKTTVFEARKTLQMPFLFVITTSFDSTAYVMKSGVSVDIR